MGLQSRADRARSGGLGPALKSSVLGLLDGRVAALTTSLDLCLGPTELCVPARMPPLWDGPWCQDFANRTRGVGAVGSSSR